MSDSSAALGRLVAHENSASDLLAFLFERDPNPLITLLGLDVDVYRCRREGRTPAGRLDVMVRRVSDDLPVAVLELKGASSEHGDQLDRYQAWAARFDPVPLLLYCTLDGGDDISRAPWRRIGLTELFDAWSSAGDPHAVWLSHEIAKVLRGWDEEADGVIGVATGWYVPDLISRRTARAVNDALRRAHPDDGVAEASRTSVGNPMLMAWRRHPCGPRQARIAVDVRSQGRGEPARPWLLGRVSMCTPRTGPSVRRCSRRTIWPSGCGRRWCCPRFGTRLPGPVVPTWPTCSAPGAMTVSEVVPSPRHWRNGELSSNRMLRRQGTIRSSARIADGALPPSSNSRSPASTARIWPISC